jgi:hypothetical protein
MMVKLPPQEVIGRVQGAELIPVCLPCKVSYLQGDPTQ